MSVTFPIVSLADGGVADGAWFDDITAAVNDHENRISPGWTTYTPSWTGSSSNPAIGNGTITGRYRRTSGTSDLVLLELYLRAGSTTTYGSGFWSFGLPVNAHAQSVLASSGTAYFYDTGTITRSGTCRLLLDPASPGGLGNVLILDHPTLGPITNLVPHTWANTDILSAQIQYQPV